jgi:dihydroneopterin aldolase
MAVELLRVFPVVQAVEVEVIKLKPPVDFTCAGLAVRVRRTRKT